jgi:cyclopropane-fatty-acyl-phospholipid synthase
MTTAVTPSVGRWPDLHVVPSGFRSRIESATARRLFSRAVNRLPVSVRMEGRTLGRGGPVAVVHRPDELFARLGRDQLIGFGEAYLTGAWDAEDLAGFLTVLAADLPGLVPPMLQTLRSFVVARPPRHHEGTQEHTRNNVAHHYDLSNDLFRLFLDPTLSYSCALFAGDPARATAADLETAQIAKIDRMLDLAGVCTGTRLLDIGTGWGELAIRAAQRGAIVRTLTLSTEQAALARERIRAAGVAHLVTVELCDYREATGIYDAVVSVEMIEAVGWRHWQTYLETIDRVLRPGGVAAIQAITMPHDRMLATRRSYTWMNKYVFPGGFLPSVPALERAAERHTDLRLTQIRALGAHYAATLRIWDETFRARADEVQMLGFDETFLRMWHFYLEYCRAGFISGYLDDHQLVFDKAER